MSRRQSLADRLNRFKGGCCPVHGLFMSQIDGWYYPEDRAPYTVVGCPRRDCDARAMANSYDGPWELMPDCAYLLDKVLPLSVLATKGRTKSTGGPPRAKKSEMWAKTEGKCYYCGLILDSVANFSVDHVVAKIHGGSDSLENVVLACRSCNSTKGTKSLEDFRFYKVMQRFQELNGVAFTREQVAYLNTSGVELDIPEHTFWFEQH